MFSSYALWTYIWKAVFHLISRYHPYPSGDSYPAIFYASPFIIIALVGMVVWAVRKFRDERELILFGSLFFLVNIALLLQIVLSE